MALRGAEVTMATLEAGPQVERLGEQVSERLARLAAGVRRRPCCPEAKLAEIAAEPGGAVARFEDGRERDADAVLLALGIARNDGLAAAAGVEVDDGVLVDAVDALLAPAPARRRRRRPRRTTPPPAAGCGSNTGARR